MIKTTLLTLTVSVLFWGNLIAQTDKATPITIPKLSFGPMFAKYDKLIDTKFPDFDLQGLANQERNLALSTGKPVVVNFWFTRCPPCIEEMPALNELKVKYGNKVDFVAITVDAKQTVADFLVKHKFDFDQFVNAKKLIDALGIDTYPLTFFLDKSGTIKQIMPGIPILYGGVIDKLL